jgi:hypothetical protein
VLVFPSLLVTYFFFLLFFLLRSITIATDILLIFPILNFALAAPVSIQDKCQLYINVVDMPEEVIIVSEKRGDPLDLQWEKILPEVVGKTGGAHKLRQRF